MIDPIWEEKLSFLVLEDQSMREVLLKKGILSDAYHPEMEKIHISNAKKLSDLIFKMGFPVLSNAGEKSVRLSWLIIHHSISLPDFMRECVLQMRLAAANHDYPLDLLAYTEDRIAFFEGRPQQFGTNYDWLDGELKPTPIFRPDELSMRRKAMGLPPISSITTGTMDRPPKDPKKKALEFQAWLEKVGWK